MKNIDKYLGEATPLGWKKGLDAVAGKGLKRLQYLLDEKVWKYEFIKPLLNEAMRDKKIHKLSEDLYKRLYEIAKELDEINLP